MATQDEREEVARDRSFIDILGTLWMPAGTAAATSSSYFCSASRRPICVLSQ